MTARDTSEQHRVSSPLELLFDLTFVAAISQVADQLAHSIENGSVLVTLAPFFMVFFAIWLAWINFTWFASAYDTDDVLYRLLTLLQMGGVLVLAAGVPLAFEHQNFTALTIGYVIMRTALVAQWLRAAVQHPEGRRTALRYAGSIFVIQILWVVRLAFPDEAQFWLFIALAILELCVAPFAGETAWHPHHIAERYGLFTIILLGESVLAATVGVQGVVSGSGVTAGLIVIAVSSLVILFAMWWIYFSKDPAEGLERYRGRAFIWGYGHYGVFAALAALGAGFEAAVASLGGHEAEIPASHFGFAVAIPVAVFLLLLWVLHTPIHVEARVSPTIIVGATVLVLLVPLLPIGVPTMLALIAGVLVALLALTLALENRTLKS